MARLPSHPSFMLHLSMSIPSAVWIRIGKRCVSMEKVKNASQAWYTCSPRNPMAAMHQASFGCAHGGTFFLFLFLQRSGRRCCRREKVGEGELHQRLWQTDLLGGPACPERLSTPRPKGTLTHDR